MHPLIQEIEKAQRKESVPDFGAGDTVRVHVKVVEGGKERVSARPLQRLVVHSGCAAPDALVGTATRFARHRCAARLE